MRVDIKSLATQASAGKVSQNASQLKGELDKRRAPHPTSLGAGQKSMILYTKVGPDADKEKVTAEMDRFLSTVPGYDVEENSYKGTDVSRRFQTKSLEVSDNWPTPQDTLVISDDWPEVEKPLTVSDDW